MIMLYNKSPISWKSKMQKTTALSTAEAEYYSASTAATEVLYAAFSWTDWDSPRLALLQSMRITQHVLSGATTSSADEKGPT